MSFFCLPCSSPCSCHHTTASEGRTSLRKASPCPSPSAPRPSSTSPTKAKAEQKQRKNILAFLPVASLNAQEKHSREKESAGTKKGRQIRNDKFCLGVFGRGLHPLLSAQCSTSSSSSCPRCSPGRCWAPPPCSPCCCALLAWRSGAPASS